MQIISRRRFSTGLAAALTTAGVLAAAPAAFAQAFPSKPIKLIAPYPPGGGVDTVARLLAERLAARKARDFARADAIRKELSDAGVILEDGPQGTAWRRA